MSCPSINSIFAGELLELLDPDILIGFNLPNISAQSIGIKKSTSPVIYALILEFKNIIKWQIAGSRKVDITIFKNEFD